MADKIWWECDDMMALLMTRRYLSQRIINTILSTLIAEVALAITTDVIAWQHTWWQGLGWRHNGRDDVTMGKRMLSSLSSSFLSSSWWCFNYRVLLLLLLFFFSYFGSFKISGIVIFDELNCPSVYSYIILFIIIFVCFLLFPDSVENTKENKEEKQKIMHKFH